MSLPRLSTPQVVLQDSQSAERSLLNVYSIHELHDPDRIAKRLFRQILKEINKADDEPQPTTDPEDTIDFWKIHSLADVVRILLALLRACGSKEASIVT
ncbi:MAG: hypothetical protein U0930_23245 [Pirellulales bacterium]